MGVTYQGIMDQANKAMAGYDKARIMLVPPRSFRALARRAAIASCCRTAKGAAMTLSMRKHGR
jgi:hypothetical protein